MINISFADTSGSYDYDRIRTLSYTNTNCFVLCFSLVNRQSFENITTRWVPEIDHYNQIAPIFIIGTKSDLSRDQEYLRKKGNGIPIHPNEIIQCVKEVGAITYLETSSVENFNIIECYKIIIAICTYKKNKKKCKIQ